MREDALRACRTSKEKKRWLDTKEFRDLNPIDRCEATLWLVFPRTMRFKVICRMANVPMSTHCIRDLCEHGRIMKVERGLYRFRQFA